MWCPTKPAALTTPVTPVTPVTVEAFGSLHDFIMEEDSLRVENRDSGRFRQHLEKLTRAAQFAVCD